MDTSSLHRVIAVAVLGIVAVPAATTALLQSTQTSHTSILRSTSALETNIRDDAQADAARVRQQRRDYWKAVDVYNMLDAAGKADGFAPPDVSDRDSIDFYLYYGSTHAAAPEETEAIVLEKRYNQLLKRYQDQLDAYVATRRCPGVLRNHVVADFYDLCLRMLDQQIAIEQETVHDRSVQQRAARTTSDLQKRLKILEESLTVPGAYVKPPNGDGARPRL